MSYNILALRTAEAEGDWLYPLLGDDHLIGLDEADGTRLQTFAATKLSVTQPTQSGLRTLIHTPETKAELFVTDARIAVACEKYEKGGGWIGTPSSVGTTMALNAISKARVAVRRRGKVLVGHVRYQWLRGVGFAPRAGFGTHPALRFQVLDRTSGADRDLFLDVTLPKQTDPATVAQQIARRAAVHNLGLGLGKTDEHRAAYERLAAGDTVAPVKGQFSFYRLPRVLAITKSGA